MTAPRYLLDTNICIYIRRRRPNEVLRRFATLRAGEAAISVITYGELRYGAEKNEARNEALRLLSELTGVLPVLSLTSEVAEKFGLIQADLAKRGEIIGTNDLWIAAHAITAGLILVSNNEREFRRVKGLRLENWVTH